MEKDKTKRPERDQYRAGLAVRNGWRCRLCGRYPEPGKPSRFVDGVCPSCRNRLEDLQSHS